MSDSSTGIDPSKPSSPDHAPKPPKHPDESTASESLNNLEATWTDIRLGGDGLPSVPGYEIITTLGHGGMGVVYKALQVRANRLVALKMIKDRGPASPELLARFRTEIEAVASLQNPQVVQIFEVGEFDGQPYFSMEFCSGGNLKERLRGQPQPPLEAAALVELLARGVHAAHGKGVVHRDLKPANVLIDEAGHLKVSDFGLAKRIDREGHTNTGAVLGTPSYMAPEQAVGNVHDIGPRTDVYALGAILYECLTGRPPFQAPSDLEIMAKVVAAEPIQPSRLQSGVPRQLETVVLKALEKTTARRYATAKDLADDLARFQSGESVLAVRAGPLRRLGVYVRRRPTIAALCALIVFMALSTAVGFVWAYTQALSLLDKTRAANQQSIRTRLEQLRTAAPAAVPQLLRSLREDGVASADQLRELWSQTDAGEKLSRVRLGLALLPDDPSVRDELTQWMLDADDLRETLLTRDALTPFAPELTPRLWRVVDDPDEVTSRQWRALAALAAFDPASDRWKAMGPEIAEHLLTANPLTIGAWTDAFRPLRAELLESLKAAFVSQQLADKRAAAASVLADFSRDQPEVLPEMIEHADEPALLKPLLDDQRDLALRLLRPRLDATPGPLCDCTSTRLARVHRQAAAAAALMAIGDDADLWRLFARSEDPTLRSHLVYDMAALDIDPRRIAHRLKDESNPGIRQALILALGDYTAGRLPHSARATLTPILLKWYRDDPDPGVHSSIDWLLRPTNEGLDCRKISWGEADGLARIDRELAERPRPPDRRWLVTKHGHTLAIVAGPVEAHLGDCNSEINRAADEPPDPQWVRNIPRSFGIATRLITVRQFNEFLAAEPPGVERPKEPVKKADDLPINGVDWYTAAKYCRWLSEREAVPAEQMCYPAMDQIKDGMILPSDYLQRTGYRVPTEAEWEFAARAGAATIWCCGDDPSMLGRYVVYAKNGLGRVWPVGQKRPNDLGLFEPHGTLWNWCSDPWDEAPSSGDDDHPASSLSDTQRRVLRGGSFGDGDVNARCSNRNGSALVNGMSHGLRIARTIR